MPEDQTGLTPGEGGTTGESPTSAEEDVKKEPQTEEDGVTQGESPASDEGDDGSPKHASAEDRIKYLWKLNKEKEEELERLKAELDKVRAPTETPQTSGEPRLEDYDSIEEYTRAVAEYTASKKIQEMQQKEMVKRAWEPFLERANKLDPEQYPDLDKAIKGDGVIYSDVAREFVRTSKIGPQLAYHFYKNPDIAYRIAQMPLADQVQKLVDIQSELVRAKEPRSSSNAPEPLNPVGDKGGEVSVDPEKMSIEEWVRWRREQLKQRR